jgi:hypothetical protein
MDRYDFTTFVLFEFISWIQQPSPQSGRGLLKANEFEDNVYSCHWVDNIGSRSTHTSRSGFPLAPAV